MDEISQQFSLPTPEELILWDVIEEHFGEAEFLFGQRNSALISSTLTLEDLERNYERWLQVHLEGLVIGGPAVAERLLYPELIAATNPDRSSIAALVLLMTGSKDDWREVFEAMVYAQSDEQRSAISRGINLYDAPHFETIIEDSFAYAHTPREKAFLLDLLASRHLDPGSHLDSNLDIGYPPLRQAIIRAAGRAGRFDFALQIEGYLESDDPELRAVALEAGLFLGLSSAWSLCRRQAAGTGEAAAPALLLVALLGGPSDHRIIEQQLENDQMRESALWALGFTGRPESADLCFPYLESPDARTAQHAAEALATVVGFDAPRNDTVQAALSEGNQFPIPDSASIKDWYTTNRGRFSDGERYLFGQPHTPKTLVQNLRCAPLRYRPVLSSELAYRTRGKRFVAADALVARQRKQIDTLSDLEDKDFVNRFGKG